MKVLIIDDDADKIAEIGEIIGGVLRDASYTVEKVGSVNEAMFRLGKGSYDLVIADLVLPQIRGSTETQDATLQWSQLIEGDGSIRLSTWIVMTSFANIANSAREVFARHGVAVIEYERQGYWKRVLEIRLKELFVNKPLDFLIICALSKEANGFRTVENCLFNQSHILHGVSCQYVNIGELRGVISTLPEPGLVTAAIVTTKMTTLLKPKIVAMAGICGGFAGESTVGDIIAPDVAWNYQTGKFKNGSLIPELMQTPVPPITKAILQQMSASDCSFQLRNGLFNSELRNNEVHVAAMVSGSPVIADENESLKIATQSRKIAGLDMEVASIFAVAHDFFNGGGAFFAAKVVVDMANGQKDDRYHEYGCALSARFTAFAIEKIHAQLDNG